MIYAVIVPPLRYSNVLGVLPARAHRIVLMSVLSPVHSTLLRTVPATVIMRVH